VSMADPHFGLAAFVKHRHDSASLLRPHDRIGYLLLGKSRLDTGQRRCWLLRRQSSSQHSHPALKLLRIFSPGIVKIWPVSRKSGLRIPRFPQISRAAQVATHTGVYNQTSPSVAHARRERRNLPSFAKILAGILGFPRNETTFWPNSKNMPGNTI